MAMTLEEYNMLCDDVDDFTILIDSITGVLEEVTKIDAKVSAIVVRRDNEDTKIYCEFEGSLKNMFVRHMREMKDELMQEREMALNQYDKVDK